jgi:hypothetical protein
MERTLRLHSLRFTIRSDHFALDDLLDRLYEDNELTDGFAASSLELRLDPLVASGDPPASVFAETNLCGGPCFWDGHQFITAIGGEYPLRISYDPAAGVAHAYLGGRFLDNTQAIIGRVIRATLQSFVLPFHGLTPLHGALVARDGRGTLLAGVGGAGKTTTAIALALRGFTMMSDDGPLLARCGGQVVGLSSLDYVHASVGTLALFDALVPYVVGGLDHRDKYAVGCGAFRHGPERRHPVSIDRYIELCRRPTAAPRLVPLDPASVLRDLVRERMVVFRKPPLRAEPRFRRYSDDMLALLSALVGSVRAYRLEFDDHHLAAIPGLLETIGA